MRTVTEYNKLLKVDAWGAIEDGAADKIALGYQMFEVFRAGRKLKHLNPGIEFLPWLYKARIGSKFWEDNFLTAPPFCDHVRHFIDENTKQRIYTIQPYIPSVAKETGSPASAQDFRCKALGVPKEFWAIYCDCVSARLKDKFQPLPDLPVVKETIAALLAKAKKVSDEIADKHGLHVKVSFNGFYNPQQVILIEYTKAVQQ